MLSVSSQIIKIQIKKLEIANISIDPPRGMVVGWVAEQVVHNRFFQHSNFAKSPDSFLLYFRNALTF